MIPAPSQILARELVRGPGLSIFVHKKAFYGARVNTAPGRIAISIWDLSKYTEEVTDHESREVPERCVDNFPVGWKQVVHCATESDAVEQWGDWVVLPHGTEATEPQTKALSNFISTINIDKS